MDFAMKFEETKYLEKQDEFYAKRGMTWHITVLAFNENKRLKTLTLVHLIEETQQDSNCVLGIIDSVLSFINNNFENVLVNIRSDNAGCYHSKDLICLLALFAKKHKVKVLSYHFSEPQLGKDICDRKISVLRRTIIQYINEGNNVTNIEQMKEALLSNKQLKDVVVFKQKANIPNISKYYSITYEGENIRFFHFYNIGSGMETQVKDLINADYEIIKELVEKASLEIFFDSSSTFSSHDLILAGKKSKEFYDCEKCDKKFFSKIDLEFHESLHEQKISQIDKVQIKYAKACNENRINIYQQIELKNSSRIIETQSKKLMIGFAIKIRKNVRFNEEQIKYLVDLFEKGEIDKKNRARASAVEADMISKFPLNLCLNEKQIKSYFSRLSANKTKSKSLEAKDKISVKRKLQTLNNRNSKVPKNNENKNEIYKNNDFENENADEENELFHDNEISREGTYKLRKRLFKNISREIDDEDEL